ncbi:glycoside hydrolase family 15 protein [Micromonospora parva]|uniref:glycoside hydrolase family 15 protein n=1 Tax=Micromonospora parva TaxID=1464048 RepID=UPI0037AB2295
MAGAGPRHLGDPRAAAALRQLEDDGLGLPRPGRPRDLAVGPALIRRYTADDGLPGQEGAFLLCCFELVSALVLAGRREQAAELFDQLCGYAGPLGLYAEQLDADGTALGNYPQAFTHLALIEAALNLDGAGDRDALHAWAQRAERPGTTGG